MGSIVLPLTILALFGVAYLLVTMVLYTLATDMKHDLDKHELIREARVTRAEYLASLKQRREAAGEATVEIVGPEPGEADLVAGPAEDAGEPPAIAGAIEPADDAEPARAAA